MRLTDDPEIISPNQDDSGRKLPLKVWSTSHKPHKYGGTFSLLGSDEVQDVAAVQKLFSALQEVFPLPVKGILGESIIRSDVYYSDGFNEKAQTTSNGHWMMISAGSVDFLRRMSYALITNSTSREVLKLDELGPDISQVISEVILWVGIDFLLMHEFGHIMHGHTSLNSSLASMSRQERILIQKSLECDADEFAAVRLAEVICSRQTFLSGLPRSSNQIPPHMFATMSMMSALLVFAGLAIRNRTDHPYYPAVEERILSISGVTIGTAEQLSYGKLDINDLMHALQVAVNAVCPILLEFPRGTAAVVYQAMDIFNFRKDRLDDFRRAQAGVNVLSQTMDSLMPRLRPVMLRRARHNPWDSNW
jgi:hypothetical protein